VAFLDADGQHDPEDLPRLLDAARAGDPFVIGSRMDEAEAIPAYRHRTNEIGSRILSRMTGLEVEDAQSGYRVVAADLREKLFSTPRLHHRDRDAARRRRTCAASATCRRAITAGRRTIGRFGIRG
jgi:glycosyltransferase involved in cell wall biosynthesis